MAVTTQAALESLEGIDNIVREGDTLIVLKVALEEGRLPSSHFVEYARQDLRKLIQLSNALLEILGGAG